MCECIGWATRLRKSGRKKTQYPRDVLYIKLRKRGNGVRSNGGT